MAVKNVITAVREAMAEEMRRDPQVIVLGQDVGVRGGVFLATEGFVQEFGEERVIDTPLAEASIVGIAVGAAVNGLRPIAEIQFTDFIWPIVNQLVGEAARMRYGSNGQLGVPLVVRSPYGGPVRGGLYHSQSVEGFFYHTPGLKVICPSTPYDAKGLLKSAIRDNDPTLFLEHKRTYRLVRGEVPEDDYTVPIGVADVKRPGEQLSVISYGLTLHYSLEAAERLAQEGLSVEVLDLRTVKPLDRGAITATARKTGKVLIVHEDNLTGGVGAEVAAIIAEEAFTDLDAPVMRLCGPDVPGMPFAPTLEAAFYPGLEKIVVALRGLAAY
jgi:2-oxoisovalerate dehydrogenase E1 component beta subunit